MTRPPSPQALAAARRLWALAMRHYHADSPDGERERDIARALDSYAEAHAREVVRPWREAVKAMLRTGFHDGHAPVCNRVYDRANDCNCGASAARALLRDDGATPPTINELIERSSLGTPEAKAIRAKAPPGAVAKVLARVAELDAAAPPAVPGTPDLEARAREALAKAIHGDHGVGLCLERGPCVLCQSALPVVVAFAREYASEETYRLRADISKAWKVHDSSTGGECYFEQSGGPRCVRDSHYRLAKYDDITAPLREVDRMTRELAEAREEIAAWRRVGLDFMPFFHGERTELRHIEEAVVIFTKMRALLDRPAPPVPAALPGETT